VKQFTVSNVPLLIPAGTVIKLSDFEVGRRAHLLEKQRANNTYLALHSFQLKVGTRFSIDEKRLMKLGDNGFSVKEVGTEEPPKKNKAWSEPMVHKPVDNLKESSVSDDSDTVKMPNTDGLKVELE